MSNVRIVWLLMKLEAIKVGFWNLNVVCWILYLNRRDKQKCLSPLSVVKMKMWYLSVQNTDKTWADKSRSYEFLMPYSVLYAEFGIWIDGTNRNVFHHFQWWKIPKCDICVFKILILMKLELIKVRFINSLCPIRCCMLNSVFELQNYRNIWFNIYS